MPNEVKGEPTQVEIGGKRFYRVDFTDGNYRLLRSVTTICKGARIPSFLDVWEREQIEAIGVEGFKAALNQKALEGTIVHKAAENHIGGTISERLSTITLDDGKTYGFDEDTWPKYEAFSRWMEKRKPEFQWTERVLYSLEYGFAGRADGMAIIDGVETIVDFKTSKKAQDDHKQQGSAYLIAASEMGLNPAAVLVLPLGAETKQGYSETWLTSPYEIHQHFMGFYHKNNLVSWANPIL